jgi:hypothetical protein
VKGDEEKIPCPLQGSSPRQSNLYTVAVRTTQTPTPQPILIFCAYGTDFSTRPCSEYSLLATRRTIRGPSTGKSKRYFFIGTFKQALRSIQPPPFRCVPKALLFSVQQLGSEAEYSLLVTSLEYLELHIHSPPHAIMTSTGTSSTLLQRASEFGLSTKSVRLLSEGCFCYRIYLTFVRSEQALDIYLTFVRSEQALDIYYGGQQEDLTKDARIFLQSTRPSLP